MALTRRTVLTSLCAALSLPLTACLRAPAPIPGVKRPRAPTRHAETLVVFLPGFSDHPDDYLESGMLDALLRSGADVDALALDGHYAYYARGQLWRRVYEDAIAPARARGQRIWIVGISMGGLGALMTAERYRGRVDGLVLLSPYTGRRRTTKAIAQAGGPRRWQPPDTPGHWDVELWRWLRSYDGAAAGAPAIYLGYGLDESGAQGHLPLLASLLPAGRVYTRAGPHDWVTWKALWAEMLPTLARAMDPPR